MELLNNKQRLAAEQTKNGENILITGPAGTGKSYTIKFIIELLKNDNKKIGLTATTGDCCIYYRWANNTFFYGIWNRQ